MRLYNRYVVTKLLAMALCVILSKCDNNCKVYVLVIIIAYSEFLDEEELKPGPKYLPLGRSFQDHVEIFKRCNLAVISTSFIDIVCIVRLLVEKEIQRQSYSSN